MRLENLGSELFQPLDEGEACWLLGGYMRRDGDTVLSTVGVTPVSAGSYDTEMDFKLDM